MSLIISNAFFDLDLTKRLATHWFFKKFEVTYFEGTDGFLSSRSRLWCPFFEAPVRFARFGVHIGARTPPAEAGLAPDIHWGEPPLLWP